MSVQIVRVIAFCFFLALSAFSSTGSGTGGRECSSLANLSSLLRGLVTSSCDALRFRICDPGDGLIGGGGGKLGRVGWKRLVGGSGEKERRERDGDCLVGVAGSSDTAETGTLCGEPAAADSIGDECAFSSTGGMDDRDGNPWSGGGGGTCCFSAKDFDSVLDALFFGFAVTELQCIAFTISISGLISAS